MLCHDSFKFLFSDVHNFFKEPCGRYQGSADKLKKRSEYFIFFHLRYFIVKISVTSAIVVNAPTRDLCLVKQKVLL